MWYLWSKIPLYSSGKNEAILILISLKRFLFRILKNQYLTYVFINFKEAL